VLKAGGSEASTGANESGLMMLQVSSEALAKLQLPGVKSMAQQLAEGNNWKPPPPEPGFHRKLVKALPDLKAECNNKLYATRDDCELATKMMESFIKITDGPEPVWTWHGQIRTMMALNFWLYMPGTSFCFSMLDKDQSGNVTLQEMTQLFGAQAVKSNQAVFGFLDANNDGAFTREELHKYLRACIMIRDFVPSVDMIDTKADTKKCLNMAHRVLNEPKAAMKQMGFYPKVLCILAILFGAVLFHWTVGHRLKAAKPAQPKGPEGAAAAEPSK